MNVFAVGLLVGCGILGVATIAYCVLVTVSLYRERNVSVKSDILRRFQ